MICGNISASTGILFTGLLRGVWHLSMPWNLVHFLPLLWVFCVIWAKNSFTISTLCLLFPSKFTVLKDKACTFLQLWIFYESLQKALVSAGCSMVQHMAENWLPAAALVQYDRTHTLWRTPLTLPEAKLEDLPTVWKTRRVLKLPLDRSLR